MAVGFAIDYNAHIGHAFIAAKGTSTERATEAVATAGRAVVNAGVTTLLAMVSCAAGSPIFIVFSKMFVGIAGFGLLHALVFLPVVLSYFPQGWITEVPEESETPPRSSKVRVIVALGFACSATFLAIIAFVQPWITWTEEVLFDNAKLGVATVAFTFAGVDTAKVTECVEFDCSNAGADIALSESDDMFSDISSASTATIAVYMLGIAMAVGGMVSYACLATSSQVRATKCLSFASFAGSLMCFISGIIFQATVVDYQNTDVSCDAALCFAQLCVHLFRYVWAHAGADLRQKRSGSCFPNMFWSTFFN